MLSRLRPGSPPVRSSMREGSIPFSCVRYCATLRSRWAAASGVSSAECLPTITSLAEDSRLRVRAISSRQPLASLSTRTGRFLSRSKETLQRLITAGGGGGGGACDGDRRVGGGLFAEVVDDVAGDGDGARRCATGGDQSRSGRAAGDLPGGGRVRVSERTVLRAGGDRRDRRWIARHHGAGIGRAGDRRRLVGVNAEAGGATGLLTRADALGDVTRDGVVAGGESCGCDGSSRVGAGDTAAAGGPSVGGLLLQVEVAGRRGDSDGIAGKDVRRLNCATELDGWRRRDLAQAENDTRGETVRVDLTGAAGDMADVGWAVVYVE